MAYESKIVVVKKFEGSDYADIIATVKMSSMYDGFNTLFTNDVDYDVYIENGDEPTKTDKYGNSLKWTDANTIITYLEEKIRSGEEYRRLFILLGLLKGFRTNDWDMNEIEVIHYGY